MGKRRKQWMIKDVEGLLKGPFSTDQVLDLIHRSELSGDETISEYPGSDWFPISKDPVFYDRLLEVLSRPPKFLEESTNHENDIHQSYEEVHPLKDKSLKSSEPQPGLSSSSHLQDSLQKEDRPRKAKKKRPKNSENFEQDIELVDVKKKIKLEALRRSSKYFLFIFIIFALGLYFLLTSDRSEVEEERIHLLAPQQGSTTWSAEQIKAKVYQAMSEYVRDTFSGYLRAENALVQSLEGYFRNPEALALLCLTYYELWPFAFQDSADMKVISQVTQSVSALDKAGLHSATCKTVDLLLKGRYSEAQSLSGTTLETMGASGQPPIPFYYFMAILSEVAGDFKTAIGYLTSVQQLWPQWSKPFVYQAQLLARTGNFTDAAKIYHSVLAANPEHDVAKIELGLLEYKYFRNPEKGEAFIKSGVSSTDRISRKILSRGYFGLSEIYLQKRDQGEALAYARQSYALDSTNSLAKNLVIQIGGTKELSKTKFKSYQLIAEGDQFYREGDCTVAQAHYKAAYEVDSKSAVAAMKAGECLWKLGLSTEAIEWMNKAIRADHKLIEAYVTLADYYSQRYNFVAAAQVLLSAQRDFPKSYEVYRGFALVELRRKNPKAAVEYAKQSLAIYDTDVESHIVIAEAYLELGDGRQAFAHASRATEIDVNHRKAQIIFGRSLGGVQGADAAITFLSELVKKYPLVNDYRMALGQQFLEDERFSEAERVFYELTQIDEKSKEGFLQLGKTLRFQKLYERALDALLKAAILDPADAEPLFQAGLLYLDIQKPEEAQAQFRRVLKINKFYPLVHYYLGQAALLMNNFQEVLAEAKEERQVNPNMAEAYLLAAKAYAQLKQYSLCVGEYQKAIKLRPQSAEIYIEMARCYRGADQLGVAIAMLNQAATKESGRPEIYRELGVIYEIKGDLINAITAYKQYFVLYPNAPDRGSIESRIMSKGQPSGP